MPTSLRVTGDGVNIRGGPGTEYSVFDKRNKGDVVQEIDIDLDKWCPILITDDTVDPPTSEVDFISRQYLEPVETPAPSATPAPTPAPKPSPASTGQMKISPAGVDFIKKQENCVLHLYDDAGHQAIGWGHDITPSDPDYGAGITQAQADDILVKDLATVEDEVNSYDLPLSQNQYDALVDFAFNCGGGNLKKLLSHGLDQVPQFLPQFCHSQGVVAEVLVKRRAAELNLWNTPDGKTAPVPAPSVHQVSVSQLLALAETEEGKDYDYGGKASGSNPSPDGLDCSGLVAWDCNRLGVKPAMPDGARNQRDHCVMYGGEISVEEARNTPGALLFRIGVGEDDHVAFSVGGDHTFEAEGKAYGICYVDGASNRTWTNGAKIPGVVYPA
jgi:GH24 family phage-related lysozyme (muramidase)